ncbi:MAG: hypothetical protein ASARMPREDX12_002723 [Alectoria sarmentosa]|nr:MAG: hypothetical protein ASARMPREDX12_002723 [Alectoria sarmentosa]
MASFFDEQYPENGWNDFINSNYATGGEDPTLFSSLDYFDLSAGNSHADRISTPACIDHANVQDSLGGQDSRLRTGETRFEYTEIKALIAENSRQIDQLGQHVESLHPYFEAMRSTLKDLTEQVNRQWVVKTPITPFPKREDGPSRGVNSGKANKGEIASGERKGG